MANTILESEEILKHIKKIDLNGDFLRIYWKEDKEVSDYRVI